MWNDGSELVTKLLEVLPRQGNLIFVFLDATSWISPPFNTNAKVSSRSLARISDLVILFLSFQLSMSYYNKSSVKSQALL
jgi:hypothetical protein